MGIASPEQKESGAMPEPTPAPDLTTPSDPQADARKVIAQVIADGKSMMVPARVEWTDEAKAEQILAALAEAGYVIVDGGTATKAQDWGMRLPSSAWTDTDQKHMEALSAVLDRAARPDGAR
jgi:hypothetical protein